MVGSTATARSGYLAPIASRDKNNPRIVDPVTAERVTSTTKAVRAKEVAYDSGSRFFGRLLNWATAVNLAPRRTILSI